jgi:5-methylcytosine-specific restriction endonuclease McrA
VKRVSRHHIDQLLKRQGNVCALCGGWLFAGDELHPWHIDHIVSIANGGKHELSNLQITHGQCNQRKGAN